MLKKLQVRVSGVGNCTCYVDEARGVMSYNSPPTTGNEFVPESEEDVSFYEETLQYGEEVEQGEKMFTAYEFVQAEIKKYDDDATPEDIFPAGFCVRLYTMPLERGLENELEKEIRLEFRRRVNLARLTDKHGTELP